MKKLLLLSLLLGLWTFGQAQTREIYTHPQFSTLSKEHKELAIIPFKVTIQYKKLPKDVTVEQMHQQELQDGKSVQSALHTYFLKNSSSDGVTVRFQDPNKTNALLAKAGIDEKNIHMQTTEDLARILGTDAIISGQFITDKPMSEGAAVAMYLLVGFAGPTNSGKTSISINDAKTSELLWKYDKTLSRSFGSDSNTIINTIMRKAGRQFPYAKS